MQISISDPILQTKIFILGFLFITLVTLRKDINRHEMLISHTNELKGVAILLVLFGHVGYFLSSDNRFLFPLSIGAGVGVNIFLFLSGFGITVSMLNKKLSPWAFYKKRLPQIFIPMWLVLTVILVMDLILFQKWHPNSLLLKNYLGFYPRADIFIDINSPLWYFTWILFYYLVYPWIFVKKYPSVSALTLFLITTVLLSFKLPVVFDVQKLYILHTLAFPFGMIFATFLHLKPLSEIRANFYFLRESHKKIIYILRYVLMAVLSYAIYYTAINSGIGQNLKIEQIMSMITTLSFVALFLLKRYKSEFLVLLGIYSYEIYLIQWPLMYRYDFIYKHVPAGIATLVYLFVLILIGIIFNRIVKKISLHK
ncbi:acyltransferase [candidate division WWE3 bacterium]|uniref:Acyltransferase n=1 Tax=candidate division WWE3 bacterium TaxID=2053526 RepID=A0A7X9DLD6_UNCKA|nr:acyltransferase [candidate division WWE3 bacterium]